ncbi:MAG: hypothetical protein Q8933_15240 [Bacteroidota bacterium]|nr:hypothetical protein [Bacteroidota bacterium]MDP4192806.1 hypothetical protein [Bacteroidota bacterium]MDP4197184.1 hypothetical protein [Bacteroidota bacterium]
MIDTTHIHPMIVHFPIALLFVGFLSDFISLFYKKEFFSKTGLYLLILGTLGVITAFYTGNLAGDGISETGALKQALETHEDAATLTLWIMLSAALLRIAFVWMKKYSGAFKYLAFFVFLVGILSLARTGFYGGELVYKHAAGVRLNLGLDSTPENPQKENKD